MPIILRTVREAGDPSARPRIIAERNVPAGDPDRKAAEDSKFVCQLGERERREGTIIKSLRKLNVKGASLSSAHHLSRPNTAKGSDKIW